MANEPTYTLTARLSRENSSGIITRSDGETVPLSADDLSGLFLDLAVDDAGQQNDAQHRWRTLRDWFWKKSPVTIDAKAVSP